MKIYTLKTETLMKEIEDDTYEQKGIPCPWIGRSNIVKVFLRPKAIYRFSSISVVSNDIKIPTAFFKELEWTILKL